MITAWRIAPKNQTAGAFTGDGARLYGGRWNNKGTAVIYTSSTISLASMEIMVNLPTVGLLDKYVRIAVQFTEELIEDLTELPENWDSRPAADATKKRGNRWASENRSVVLKVPSVVVPAEFNYLLNPYHPDWHKVKIQASPAYDFNSRRIMA